MSVNQFKAEKIITFPTREYKTTMSLDTIMRIEDSLEKSLIQVANTVASGNLLMSDMVKILMFAIRSGGNDIDENKVKEHITEIGYVEAVKKTGEILTSALAVDDKVADEKKN